tara:strand:+ start:21519 stop:22019 length:501 start_codon:yes stop_codon:yes gene_type:complete
MHRLLIVATLSLALAACGGSEEPAPAPTPEAAAPTQAPEPVDTAEQDAAIADAIAALPAPYNETDYKNGQRIFKQCATCHLVKEGGGHRVGPNLHGIFGKTAGHHDDFSYSKAMEKADFTWTPEQLDAWLANPKEFLPGNRMSFPGVRKPNDRVDVIGFLLIETEK